MGEHTSRSKMKRLANEEAARARRLAQPGMRLVCLADLPPFETPMTGGGWITSLRESMAEVLAKQGRVIKADNINPFEAEPCAVAVLIGTVDELTELRGRINNVADWSRGVVGDVATATAALEKIVEQELPHLNGKYDGLRTRLDELEDVIPLKDPLEGDSGSLEYLRGKVAELESKLEALEDRLAPS